MATVAKAPKGALNINGHADVEYFGKIATKRFAAPQHEDFHPEFEVYVDPWGIQEQIALAWELGEDVLILGPTGVGKTAAPRNMCHRTNRAYRRLNGQEATDAAALVGKPWLTTDENGVQEMVFQRGMVYDCALFGWVQVLDEWNLAHPDVQMALAPLFKVDEGMLIVQENEGEVVPRHVDFRLVATANPLSYAGTKEWNRAQLRRFGAVIEVDYLPREDEIALLAGQVPVKEEVAAKAVDAMRAIRESDADQRIRFPMSYSEARNWLHFALYLGLDRAAQMAVLGKAEAEDREAIMTMLKAPFTDQDWIGEVAR